MKKIRLGVLVSGRGSNLQSIIDSIEAGMLDAEIAVVISNKRSAFALERARLKGIDAISLSALDYADREDYDRALVAELVKRDVELVILAGYMRLVTGVFVEAFRGRIMNIHPSLLPSFPGIDGQRQALEYGVKVTGCTVHFVDEGLDSGPIILQAPVFVEDGDDVETLSHRILEKEHKLLPEAIQLYAEGKLSINGRRVIVKNCGGV